MKVHWLTTRRAVQLAILAAFAGAPWYGAPLVRGTLGSSRWLDMLPLTDPLLVAQMVAAGHAVAATALVGAAIVAVAVALVGGRVFCGWVCPINLVTDAVSALRRATGWRGALIPRADPRLRLLVLAAVLVACGATGALVWEWVNPITQLTRALAFGGLVAGAGAVAAVALCDAVVLKRGWCGHLCPVGALLALIGSRGSLRVQAVRAQACTHCGDCFEHCPEPQVIAPVLRADAPGLSIADRDCLRCGRCLDVCSEQVFAWQLRPPWSAEPPIHRIAVARRRPDA